MPEYRVKRINGNVRWFECDHRDGYGLVVVYSRPLLKLLRKRMHLRCWYCDLKISE